MLNRILKINKHENIVQFINMIKWFQYLTKQEKGEGRLKAKNKLMQNWKLISLIIKQLIEKYHQKYKIQIYKIINIVI